MKITSFVLAVMMCLSILAVPYASHAQDAVAISGKVVETMDAAGYTYVCVEKAKKKTWVAVPKMKVKVGDQMAFQPGMEMKNFESKTLKRTFDSIIFSGGPIPSK